MKFVIKAGEVLINGADVSANIRQVAVQMDKAEIEATGLNGNGVEEKIPGLSTEGFEIEFASDFDAIDPVIFPLFRDETLFPVSVRQDSPDGAGPVYSSAQCRLFNYHPVDGNVGQLSTTKVKFNSIEPITRS